MAISKEHSIPWLVIQVTSGSLWNKGFPGSSFVKRYQPFNLFLFHQISMLTSCK